MSMAQYLIGSGLPRLTAKKLICQGMERRVSDLVSGLSRLHSLRVFIKEGQARMFMLPVSVPEVASQYTVTAGAEVPSRKGEARLG